MSPVVRFAPSPTGRLHVGNARLALINWLFGRAKGGEFILRFDDTDSERSKEEYVEGIRTDLAWLGLVWDREERQSVRLDRYRAAADVLKAAGCLYSCYENADELDFKRKRLRAQHKAPIYDRAALALTDDERAKFEAEGRKPHWRFKLNQADVTWTDMVRGETTYNTSNVSDPVVIREDGTFLYLLPSVVDDLDHGVTHIIRGEDHVTNGAVQLEMMDAVSPGSSVIYAHVPLLTGAEGEGLSKRSGSLGLEDLRDQGLEPIAVASLLARLGSSDAVEIYADMAAMITDFDIGRFSRATPKFDAHDLELLNAKVLHQMPYTEAGPRLAALGLDAAVLSGKGEAFWQAVRGNLKYFNEVREWWEVCFGRLAPTIEDTAFAAEAATHLPPEPWSEETWGQWTGALKVATGRKGKDLFLPLRKALTGLDHGPELKQLLPVMGRERVLKRIQGETA
jgi:glutamyl-tRNA synthetase